jgi:hypothetical protein
MNNLTETVQSVLRRSSEIAKAHKGARCFEVEVCPHDDLPGKLQLLIEFTSGHIESFVIADDQDFTPQRREELEMTLHATAAIATGISNALRMDAHDD